MREVIQCFRFEELTTDVFRENGQLGICDSSLSVLLPAEYDSIYQHGTAGFVLGKKGKFGYMQFARDGAVRACLPCVYDYIVPLAHGLSLYRRPDREGAEEKIDWFELQTGRLYRNLCHHKSFREYDSFLRTDRGATMPFLKQVGRERYIELPTDPPIDILDEIPTAGEEHFFICCEFQPSENEAGFVCAYFLLTVTKEDFAMGVDHLTINELYEDLAAYMRGKEE